MTYLIVFALGVCLGSARVRNLFLTNLAELYAALMSLFGGTTGWRDRWAAVELRYALLDGAEGSLGCIPQFTEDGQYQVWFDGYSEVLLLTAAEARQFAVWGYDVCWIVSGARPLALPAVHSDELADWRPALAFDRGMVAEGVYYPDSLPAATSLVQ